MNDVSSQAGKQAFTGIKQLLAVVSWVKLSELGYWTHAHQPDHTLN